MATISSFCIRQLRRHFGPLVVAFLMMGVTHMTLSPVHRLAEELNEESQERAGQCECGTVLPQGSRRASRRLRLAYHAPTQGDLNGNSAKPFTLAFLPQPATGELACRNGYGGPLRT